MLLLLYINHRITDHIKHIEANILLSATQLISNKRCEVSNPDDGIFIISYMVYNLYSQICPMLSKGKS